MGLSSIFCIQKSGKIYFSNCNRKKSTTSTVKRVFFNLSGPAYLFYPLLSIWLVLISHMKNDILHQGCCILVRSPVGWKGIRAALPATQTSMGQLRKRWALHQCCHQTPFLRRGAAMVGTSDESTCLSYGPIAGPCKQPLKSCTYTHAMQIVIKDLVWLT